MGIHLTEQASESARKEAKSDVIATSSPGVSARSSRPLLFVPFWCNTEVFVALVYARAYTFFEQKGSVCGFVYEVETGRLR